MKTFVKFFSTLILFSLAGSHGALAQTLKLSNGIAVSSFSTKIGGVKLLDLEVKSYAVSLGMDYWENKYFYLSSEIGYFRRGGKERNFITDEEPVHIREDRNYLHINTTFRGRIPVQNSEIYLGVGPKVEILLGDSEFTKPLKGYKMNSVVYGLKPEIGLAQHFNKISVGLNFSYILDFNHLAESNYLKLRNNTYLVSFVVGYKLK